MLNEECEIIDKPDRPKCEYNITTIYPESKTFDQRQCKRNGTTLFYPSGELLDPYPLCKTHYRIALREQQEAIGN